MRSPRGEDACGGRVRLDVVVSYFTVSLKFDTTSRRRAVSSFPLFESPFCDSSAQDRYHGTGKHDNVCKNLDTVITEHM